MQARRGGAKWNDVYISCGSTFTLNVSVLCQAMMCEENVVIIPTLLVEFYPGS